MRALYRCWGGGSSIFEIAQMVIIFLFGFDSKMKCRILPTFLLVNNKRHYSAFVMKTFKQFFIEGKE